MRSLIVVFSAIWLIWALDGYRHDGICVYVPCRALALIGVCSSGRIRVLSDYKHDDAFACRAATELAYKLGWYLEVCCPERWEVAVRYVLIGFILGGPCINTNHWRYYRIFMYLYSQSLHTASFLMTNSSWTQEHVDSILAHHDSTLLLIHTLVLTLILLPAQLLLPPIKYGSQSSRSSKQSKIVYPPCETTDVVTFPIEGRERIVLSVAQFR